MVALPKSGSLCYKYGEERGWLSGNQVIQKLWQFFNLECFSAKTDTNRDISKLLFNVALIAQGHGFLIKEMIFNMQFKLN